MRVVNHGEYLSEDKAGNPIFWEICVIMADVPLVRVRFGKIGTVGTVYERSFNSLGAAMRKAHTQELTKINAGYTLSHGVHALPPVWEIEVNNSLEGTPVVTPLVTLSPQRGKWDLL